MQQSILAGPLMFVKGTGWITIHCASADRVLHREGVAAMPSKRFLISVVWSHGRESNTRRPLHQ
jgi:hypothetical protein